MTGFPCCPTCHRAIFPRAIHVTQPQREGASHTVCSEHYERREPWIRSGPLLEVLSRYFDVAEAQMGPIEWARHQRRVETR